MTILFINTCDVQGGAAVMAMRLAGAMKTCRGSNNYFIVGTKYSEINEVICSKNKMSQIMIERNINRFFDRIGCQYAFLPISSSNIIQAIKKIHPDIISLHNTHGGYFQTSLLKEISKYAPIVWTLHDMWSFNGNSAHAFDDDSWKYMKQCKYPERYPSIGINTTAWLLKQKKDIYKQSNITVVTPSKWLFNLATQAPVFEGKRIYQIYNGVDLDVFKPKDKQACRIALGFPLQEKVLMFCAEHLKNTTYKGGESLLELLADIDMRLSERVNVLVVGKGDISKTRKFQKLQIWHVGYLDNERLMATCFSAADLFVYVTIADTLPNALIESIACGTPVLTCDVGGCGEIIRDGENGYLFGLDGMSYFAEKVVSLLGQKEVLESLGKRARSYAEENFSLEKMSENYWDLFNNGQL